MPSSKSRQIYLSRRGPDNFTIYLAYLISCNILFCYSGNRFGEHPYKKGKGAGKLVCGKYDCDHPYGKCKKE